MTIVSDPIKDPLITALLKNQISSQDLAILRPLIDEADLSLIIQKIYDLNEIQVYKIAALENILAKINNIKNSQRNQHFRNKIAKGFRKPENRGTHKVILAEGDSWFNYPVLLSDVIDRIAMEENLAVYSLASGGDWLLNMLSARTYVEQMSVIHPDVFLISAGGNDLVGSSRLSAIVQPLGGSQEFKNNPWAMDLIAKREAKPIVPYDSDRFTNGVAYLSKDFFALLMFFHLQYYFLINGLLTGHTNDPAHGKFPDLRIITQGYDYAIPSTQTDWGKNPLRWYKPIVRSFLGHGTWLEKPLQLRGITNPGIQKDIIYAMIFLFNEMMISTGDLFCQMPGMGNRVFHIDSRGAMGPEGWTDELHPLPENFRRVGQTFVDCINKAPTAHGQVYVVNELYPLKP